MRILFANSNFVNKAITVVNVMNGGEQDGRAFDWPSESSMLMKIPPKEKRTFTIVASAKERGSYQSVVTFKASRVQGIQETFDTQDRELTAKLIVL